MKSYPLILALPNPLKSYRIRVSAINQSSLAQNATMIAASLNQAHRFMGRGYIALIVTGGSLGWENPVRASL